MDNTFRHLDEIADIMPGINLSTNRLMYYVLYMFRVNDSPSSIFKEY